jgi:hypothetical protein
MDEKDIDDWFVEDEEAEEKEEKEEEKEEEEEEAVDFAPCLKCCAWLGSLGTSDSHVGRDPR